MTMLADMWARLLAAALLAAVAVYAYTAGLRADPDDQQEQVGLDELLDEQRRRSCEEYIAEVRACDVSDLDSHVTPRLFMNQQEIPR